MTSVRLGIRPPPSLCTLYSEYATPPAVVRLVAVITVDRHTLRNNETVVRVLPYCLVVGNIEMNRSSESNPNPS